MDRFWQLVPLMCWTTIHELQFKQCNGHHTNVICSKVPDSHEQLLLLLSTCMGNEGLSPKQVKESFWHWPPQLKVNLVELDDLKSQRVKEN